MITKWMLFKLALLGWWLSPKRTPRKLWKMYKECKQLASIAVYRESEDELPGMWDESDIAGGLTDTQ